MRGGIKAKAGHPVELAFRRPQSKRGRQIELCHTIIDLPCLFARLAIGKFIYVPPFRGIVGPNKRTESLNKPIAASAAKICFPHILRNPRRLRRAQH
jgi:hypothetical protein